MTTTLGRRRDVDLILAHPIFFFFCPVPAGRGAILPLPEERGEHGKTTPLLQHGLPAL